MTIRFTRGFTLTELMITVAVLAILTVIALPSFAEFIERSRLRTAVDDFVSVLAAARVGAVKLDRNVSVSFGGSGTTWCVGANAAPLPPPGQRVDTNPAACDCAAAPTECMVNGQSLALSGTAFQNVALATVPDPFQIDGKLGTKDPLGPQTALFSSSTGRYQIQVQISALGEATACVPAASRPIAGIRAC